MWRNELGIEMELRQVETQVFWGMQNRLDYQLCSSSWVADYNDANTFLGMFLTGDGNNETGWSNPRYDELIHAANEQTDLAAREKFFQQAETILMHDELPIVPLYIYVGINYFDTNKISGIWRKRAGRPSVEQHPKNQIAQMNVFHPPAHLRVPLLLVISALAFALVHVAPGGPFDRDANPLRRKSSAISRPNIISTNPSGNNTAAISAICCTAISACR